MSISTGSIIGICVGVGVAAVLAGWAWKSNSDSNAAAKSQANRDSYALEQEEMIRGGKKSKRRKGRKTASKKRR